MSADAFWDGFGRELDRTLCSITTKLFKPKPCLRVHRLKQGALGLNAYIEHQSRHDIGGTWTLVVRFWKSLGQAPPLQVGPAAPHLPELYQGAVCSLSAGLLLPTYGSRSSSVDRKNAARPDIPKL